MDKKEIFIGLVEGSITDLVIPSDVKSIGDYAFYYDDTLQNVVISNGVETIGNYAFSECDAMVDVSVPNSVKSIGSNAFYRCGVTNLTLAEGLQHIDESAFVQSGLTSIVIPSTVSYIGNCLFGNSLGLNSIILTTITFKQPNGMEITLGSDLFKTKTAQALTVYTDNETIKNYDYVADNVTPTFYHLDGTLWE